MILLILLLTVPSVLRRWYHNRTASWNMTLLHWQVRYLDALYPYTTGMNKGLYFKILWAQLQLKIGTPKTVVDMFNVQIMGEVFSFLVRTEAGHRKAKQIKHAFFSCLRRLCMNIEHYWPLGCAKSKSSAVKKKCFCLKLKDSLINRYSLHRHRELYLCT